MLGCCGRVRVHVKHSYPVYQLDGYAHSSQSGVTSVSSSMIDYIKLDRFLEGECEEMGLVAEARSMNCTQNG